MYTLMKQRDCVPTWLAPNPDSSENCLFASCNGMRKGRIFVDGHIGLLYDGEEPMEHRQRWLMKMGQRKQREAEQRKKS